MYTVHCCIIKQSTHDTYIGSLSICGWGTRQLRGAGGDCKGEEGGGGWYANEMNEGVGMLLHWDLGHSSIANSLFCFIFFCAGSIVQIHVATLNPLVNSCNNVHHLAGVNYLLHHRSLENCCLTTWYDTCVQLINMYTLNYKTFDFRFDNSLM